MDKTGTVACIYVLVWRAVKEQTREKTPDIGKCCADMQAGWCGGCDWAARENLPAEVVFKPKPQWQELAIWNLGKEHSRQRRFRIQTLNVRMSTLVKGTEGSLLLCKDFRERLVNFNSIVSGLGNHQDFKSLCCDLVYIPRWWIE